jgi:hypothetical protein
MSPLTTNQTTRELYLDLMKKALTASIYDESAWAILSYARPKLGSSTNPVRFARAFLKYLLARLIVNRSTIIVKKWALDEAKRAAGRDFPLFGYTMVGIRRLDNVQRCLEDVLEQGVPGDLIETGAWRGGVTIFMRALLRAHGVTDRKIWVADSFEGLPAPDGANDDWDLSQNNYFKVSLEQVRANFSKFGLLDGQVEFLPGWFSATLPNAPIAKLAILRLDGDLYRSTMDALTHLYHKVSQGGYVIVDDYYSWTSCRRAVTEFLAARSLKPDIKAIDQDGIYWRK